MSKIKLLFVFASLLIGAQSAFADLTVGDLSRENSEAVYWKAKARAAQAKADYQKNVRVNGVGDDVEPIVKFVASANGRAYATLVYPGDVTSEVAVGDLAPGRYKIKVVQEDRVEAVKDGRTVSFVFGKTSKSTETTNPAGVRPYVNQ